MSKETLNARQYHMEYVKENGVVGAIQIMEAYADYKFKAKVNAITDEEINEHINTNHNLSDRVGSAKGLIKWFKNRLLNG